MKNLSLAYIIAIMALVGTVAGNGQSLGPKLSDDIMERLNSMNNTSIVVEKLEVAGFSRLLSEFGPFTIFAPTDEAFLKFSEKDFSNILANETYLNAVLSYHIIKGKIYSPTLCYENIKTLQGENISEHCNDELVINNAKIIGRYIECSNGIIYVIDTLLIPENLNNSIDIEDLTRSSSPIPDLKRPTAR